MTREELIADCRKDAEAWRSKSPDEVIQKLAELMADKVELLTTIALHTNPRPRCPVCGMVIESNGSCICFKP